MWRQWMGVAGGRVRTLDLREFSLKDLLCSGHHEVAASALGDPSEDHDVVDLVELGVLRR